MSKGALYIAGVIFILITLVNIYGIYFHFVEGTTTEISFWLNIAGAVFFGFFATWVFYSSSKD